ncbi:MAG: DsbE family thiol:disulfide interchange protein [Geminicoccaceae bacterium]
MRARQLLFALPIIVFIALGVGLALGLQRDPSKLPSALIDDPAPAFELVALPGDKPLLERAALENGQPVVLNVFASWCVPCRVEHPLLMDMAADGIPVYGLNYKDEPEAAARFLDELGDPYTLVGMDPDGRAGFDFGVYGVPETFVIDGTGRIRYKHVGPLTQDALDKAIVPLLEELS